MKKGSGHFSKFLLFLTLLLIIVGSFVIFVSNEVTNIPTGAVTYTTQIISPTTQEIKKQEPILGQGIVITGRSITPITGRAVSQSAWMPGVNLAGAEFGESNLPGEYGKDYIYPKKSEVDYFSYKQMNVIRIPFRWERMQRSLNADLDAAEFARLDEIVQYALSKNMYIILDPHNYARYHGNVIGSSAVPNSAFADFWKKLASRYNTPQTSKVIFGLMNEPHDMPTEQWRDAAQAAINAIRSSAPTGAGATNLILVPGNGWSGAHSWQQNWYGTPNSVAMNTISDPGNNFAFEVHQYLDSDYSGTSPTCQSSTIGSEKLTDFTIWARNNGHDAFLGEFAGGDNSVCDAATDNMLDYMEANKDVWQGWSYWSAGPWWGNYMFSLEPTNCDPFNANNCVDKPQMNNVLEQGHLGNLPPCIPTTCSAQGKNCGSISDGCGGTLNCGSCTSPQTCGGSGTPNVCGGTGCTPKTQCDAGYCNTQSDGCGGTINCPSCPSGQICSSNNQCENSSPPSPSPGPVTNTYTLNPTDDSFVTAKQPTRNYGTAGNLKIDGSPIQIAYMKYDLRNYAGKEITRAKLKMYAVDSSSSMQNVKSSMDNSWTENSINYNNKPQLDAIIAQINKAKSGTWIELDITNYVPGKAGQLMTLGIDSSGRDGLNIYSSESSVGKPELVIDVLEPGTAPPAPAAECGDGADNSDLDTLVDMNDPGCSSSGDTSEISQCEDGSDNDNDGPIDLNDKSCANNGDNDETVPQQCSDTFDNDGDGLIDMNDAGCTSSTDNDETNAPPPSGGDTVEQRINNAQDDIEEQSGGSMYQGSSDLEMMTDGSLQQWVGMRFQLNVAKGAQINKAYVQFKAKDTTSDATQLTIRGENSGNSAPFQTNTNELTNRPKTTASVSWNPVSWTGEASGADQQTTDIKSIVQEVVNRNDWVANNYIGIFVTGTGLRRAYSYEGNSAGAALIHVEIQSCNPACASGQTCVNQQCKYICEDGGDNDNDGKTDYGTGSNNDPGCSSLTDTTEYGTAICDNNQDETNDADGLADYKLSGGDPGCTSVTDSSEVDALCDNTQDDDNDGKTDYGTGSNNDPGCTGYSDNDEYNAPVYQCNDGLDNDNDGPIDYPNDKSCSSSTDNDETVPQQCSDTFDNDGDSLTDYPSDPGCSSSTDNVETDPGVLLETPANFKVAFIGDSGGSANFRNVLTLIKNEGADVVIEPGDLGYSDGVANWKTQISEVLDTSPNAVTCVNNPNKRMFPFFISQGNHDTDSQTGGQWTSSTGYRAFLRERLDCLGIAWDDAGGGGTPGNWLGTRSSWQYQNLFMTAVAHESDLGGADNAAVASYVYSKLLPNGQNNQYLWDINFQHQQMNKMQVGAKGDTTGWTLFENVRKAGAIPIHAHTHMYAMSWVMDSMTNQHVVDNNNSDGLTIWPETNGRIGRTFTVDSSSGGRDIRTQDRCDGTNSNQYPYGCLGEWASVMSSEDTQDAFGAYFIEFNVDGNPRKARAYFKTINGYVWNEPGTQDDDPVYGGGVYTIYNDA